MGAIMTIRKLAAIKKAVSGLGSEPGSDIQGLP